MCGVAGVIGDELAASICLDAMRALNHRGQDGAGLAVADSRRRNSLAVSKGIGLVKEVFPPDKMPKEKLHGDMALGHVRYPTAGQIDVSSCHPFQVDDIAVAINGNLVPSQIVHWKKTLARMERRAETSSDSELIAIFLAMRLREGKSLVQAVTEVINEFIGAFSVVAICGNEMVAFRDKYGFRPLFYGQYTKKDRANDRTWVVASETVAFDRVRATTERAIEPGEMIVFTANGERPRAYQISGKCSRRRCLLEDVYFARPDSIYDYPYARCRETCGLVMAHHYPAVANIVVPVPDSGIPFSYGFAIGAGLSLRYAIIRNHDVGRTFTDGRTRDEAVRHKYNPVRYMLAGQEAILGDDSIVRGTTVGSLIRMIRESGRVSKLHMRVSFPEVISQCYYGINIATRKELIANRIPNLAERARSLNLDSLAYPTLDDMAEVLRALGADINNYCYACCTGEYPTPL